MKKLIEYIKLHGKARIDNVKKFLWSKEIEDTLLKCNLTLQELCYRLKNNIPLDKVFLCPICNNPIKFVSGHGYQTYCNVECQKKDAGTKLNENFLKQYNIVYKSDDYYKLLKDYDLDFYQLAYRLRREIPLDKKFTCKVCGKPAIFNKSSGYSDGCCRSHITILLNKNPSVINKSIETCMKKYGSKSYVESKSYKNRYEEWKAENTKFYRNAIYTWTKLDPLKQKIARKNKLNYKVFWYNDLSDFNEWYNGLTV